jgi:urease accessory protein
METVASPAFAGMTARGDGAGGAVDIAFAPGPRLARLYHKTPLRVLLPRPAAGDPITAVIANVSGGVLGGDRLAVEVEAEAGAAALVTSQAAEKIYRSAGPEAAIETRLSVAPGAWLEWMPQEAILFDRSRLNRSIEIDLAPGARLLASESLVFGRIAHRGERFAEGLLHESWRVRRGGRLVWADALRLDEAIPQRLVARAGFGGALAASTILYAGDDAADRVDLARELLDAPGVRAGATCVAGLLVARILAAEPPAMRRALLGFWAGFREAVAGLPARAPRLWAI